MVKAQKYLDERYPAKEERKNIAVVLIGNRDLENHLDVSDFIKLCKFDCSRNRITSLDISENHELEKVFLDNNKITANLEIFSHLKTLRWLRIGTEYKKTNDFVGSLKCFEKCKDLTELTIHYNEKITEGLEYLPNNLECFNCKETIFYDILKPYDFDIMIWKLVNHPNRVVNDPKLLVEAVDDKLRESRSNLETYRRNHASETEKISRLESQTRILNEYKCEAIKANKSLEAFENFSHKMVENVVKENQELKNKVEELEGQLEQLKLEAKVEIPPKQ